MIQTCQKYEQGLRRTFAHPCSQQQWSRQPKWDEPTCPSAGEWMNEVCSILMTEYHPDVKRRGVSTHATAWMNLPCRAKRSEADTTGRTQRTSLLGLETGQSCCGQGYALVGTTHRGRAGSQVCSRPGLRPGGGCRPPLGGQMRSRYGAPTFSTTSRPPTGQGC